MIRRTHRRWFLPLCLALVGWLWLAVAHSHHDEGRLAAGAHPVCQLCVGLDRAAPPPASAAVALAAPVPLLPSAAVPGLVPPSCARRPYASRAPPAA